MADASAKPRSGATGRGNPIKALKQGDREAMLQMALDGQTAPEMLVVLSQAKGTSIRAAVAANSSTPSAISGTLAQDDDPMVRAALATRLARMMPEVGGDERQTISRRAAIILRTLAHDAEVSVRRILSEEICRLESAPKDIVMTLARDLDALVAVPVCEFSPILSDADLVELISSRPVSPALHVIARRPGIGAEVSDGLVTHGDADTIGALLLNRSAHIREATLDRVVAKAHDVECWHEALCMRPEINADLAARLSDFVAEHLIEQLEARQDLGPEATEMLRERVAARIALQHSDTSGGVIDRPTETDISDAMNFHQEARLIRLIANRAGLGTGPVKRLLSSRTPKAIVAITWKLGLSMDVAAKLQHYPGMIPASRVIEVTEDNGWPMSARDMEWQLAAFGIGEATEPEEVVP